MRSLARLGAVRARAEELMTVTLAAYSPNGATTDADGMEAPAWRAEGVTVGKVSGQSATETPRPREVTVGGVERPVLHDGLHIPVGAPVPKIGWEYAVTAVSGLADAALLGRRYHVVNVPAKSFDTARRLAVVEV